MLQMDFVLELFRKAKKKKIHTTLDTSGSTFRKEKLYLRQLDELLKVTDLILLDLKQIDESKHRHLTGKTNKNILEFARYLDEKNQPVWIRHVLVPGETDEDEGLKKLSDFIAAIHNVKRVEVLPYHNLGAYIWAERILNTD